jgi:hypothetical protein
MPVTEQQLSFAYLIKELMLNILWVMSINVLSSPKGGRRVVKTRLHISRLTDLGLGTSRPDSGETIVEPPS